MAKKVDSFELEKDGGFMITPSLALVLKNSLRQLATKNLRMKHSTKEIYKKGKHGLNHKTFT